MKKEWIANEWNKGGGGGGAVPGITQASPPSVSTSVSTVQSQADFLKKQKRKRGFAASRMAGETGPVMGGQTAFQMLGG